MFGRYGVRYVIINAKYWYYEMNIVNYIVVVELLW